MVVCPNCGAPNSDSNQFCDRCGVYLGWSSPQQPPDVQPVWPTAPQAPDREVGMADTQQDDNSTLLALFSATTLRVPVGGTTDLSIEIFNRGSQVDRVTISVIGPVASLASTTPDSLNLLPGASDTVTVTFSLGADTPVPAGTHAFGIGVTSSERPASSLLKRGFLSVEAAHAFRADMAPTALRGNKGNPIATTTMRVWNTGNAELPVRFTANEVSDALVVQVVPQTLRLQPGGEATATVSVQPTPALATSSASATLPFAVTVSAADDERRFNGSYTSYVEPPRQPRAWSGRPGCVVPLLVLALIVVAVVVFALSRIDWPTSGPPPTPTGGPPTTDQPP